ncbi:phage tail assembly chaperone [Bordetella hinzii]|jgi:hypothetical protein|uniref:phage tail assembly chaperone n=1 Tax=Bordetella hinzii TaxID=103855 RepID=UPI00045ACF21|nr:phage tail assembly chaperone [Bordetella hinzii]KCB48640.1 phage tail assembly chaperone [Bordetella hinzii 4161]KXA70625.1 phage tail protein [Bordetella hinzii LMG 13501]QDJ37922.1 phage tail protein [Bordetella hinzii]VEH25055.1 Phage tail assembly chaperone [Bordetella hinzii]
MASDNLPGGLRNHVFNPLSGFRHESLIVPEWDGAAVIVRAPSPSDFFFHRRLLWEDAGVQPGESEVAVRARLETDGFDYSRAAAALLVRTLFQAGEQGVQRVFQDQELERVAAAYGPVHERLVAKALELGNLEEGAADRAKKPSGKRRTSAS